MCIRDRFVYGGLFATVVAASFRSFAVRAEVCLRYYIHSWSILGQYLLSGAAYVVFRFCEEGQQDFAVDDNAGYPDYTDIPPQKIVECSIGEDCIQCSTAKRDALRLRTLSICTNKRHVPGQPNRPSLYRPPETNLPAYIFCESQPTTT